MSRVTEMKAKDYLINRFHHAQYKFSDNEGESGFDLWMENVETEHRSKIELKATEGFYSRQSDIFQKLYFSAENEVINFQSGNTQMLRVFLGNQPPKLFLMDKTILDNGAKFESEFRAKIIGPKNYHRIKEIQ